MLLILASGSSYRAQQLTELNIDFTPIAPNIDETIDPRLTPEDNCRELARKKVTAIRNERQGALIIGSDQIALCGDEYFGKPGTYENAIHQLKQFSGKEVRFITSICLFNTDTDRMQLDHVDTFCQFRTLNEQEIRTYVDLDQPLDCAGSFKVEKNGKLLFSAIRSDDPGALIGLPILKLNEMLLKEGVNLLSKAPAST